MSSVMEPSSKAAPPLVGARDSWRKVKFGDAVRCVDVSERNPLGNGLERYVGLEHIDPEDLHIKRWGIISEGTSFTRKFVKGQVLFGKRRAYQRKAAVTEFDGLCSGDILVFEPKNELLVPELLPFIVQSDGFFEHALQTSAGSLSPRTKWKDLADYELPLPPIEEQRRIAEILWTADEAVATLDRARACAAQVQQVAFEHHLANGGCRSKVKESPCGPIPSHWDIQRIRDVGQVQLGRQRAPRYQTGVYVRPYLRVANVFDGFLDLSDVLEMDFDERDYATYALQPGDILLNEGQSRELVGRCCIYNGEIEGCCFQNTLIRFHAGDQLLAEYAYAYFQYAFHQGVFAQIARQTTSIAHLGADRFAKLLMPVPPKEEQQAVVSTIKAITNGCDRLALHSSSAKLLRRELANDLLARRET